MDEGCLDLDGSTQGSAAALADSRLGRARHSVRAAPGPKVTWVGSSGGQGTARPTCGLFAIELRYYFPVDLPARKKRSRAVPQWVLERLPAQAPSAPETARGYRIAAPLWRSI